MTTKQIENTWLQNFRKSPLVADGVFNPSVSRQLFYGCNTDSELPFKEGFESFNDTRDISDTEGNLDKLLSYLHFVGITISRKAITDSITKGTTTYPHLFKRAFYVFKHLAGFDDTLDINNPYHDNLGDLFFFINIEKGEDVRSKQLELFDELELPDFYNKYIELPAGYENNETAQKLFRYIENSNNSIFITGKAGTGKSTFIHYFTKNTQKNVLLVAFTGIAAINIGGQTIHSFFRLPFKPLLPNDPDITIFNPLAQKRKILEQTDTIIIDEVSMLRSDVLEGLDYSLRKNGGHPDKIFGGKQLILVGDIFQLPPVVDDADEVESELFKTIYGSEYFFDSEAFKKLNPQVYEFEKDYRQSNEKFLGILNKVRDCSIDKSGIIELNKRFNPNYKPKPEEFTITLTSNKYLAKTENVNKLNSLPYISHFFKANITEDFKEDKYPTDPVLELRRNSQIMLVKNDSTDNGRRWVNGTIAKIEFIEDSKIEIRLQDGSVHTLHKETWENRQYQWDKSKGRITSKVIGRFEQFPVKLAWAITIHKSQGLSFDNVIVDLGSGAFVNGQLYTALSRCRTLEGLTLRRKVQESDIIEDKRLITFYLDRVEGRGLITDLNDFLEQVTKNDYFLLRLICVHYPFREIDIIEFSKVIKWGSGVKTFPDEDPYFRNYSNVVYGLCFNSNINWTSRILQVANFEANSYQWTGLDTSLEAFPLSVKEEISAITSAFISTNKEYHSNKEFLNDEVEERYYEGLYENFDTILDGPFQEFNFLQLEELIHFSSKCLDIYALNKSLFNNLELLFKQKFGVALIAVFGDQLALRLKEVKND